MLTKFLITVLVVVSAFVFIRYKNKPALNERPIRVINVTAQTPSKNIKLIAVFVLLLTLVTGTVMVFLNWQDEHRVFDIKIINPQTSTSDHYQAYKKDLKGRAFTTLSGQQITVSELERLEFQEIDE